ncbi:MAG: ferredoxin domain-containing protein [Candidatus Baldrarchaeia archaeon]
MPVLTGKSVEEEAVLQVAKLMAISARTAPKSKGIDDIEVAIVHGEELEKIAKKMEELANKTGDRNYTRDANSVRQSYAIVLIGVHGRRPLGMNCGLCGFESCEEFLNAKVIDRGMLRGPLCVFKLLDLGIALGSAVKTASLHNVDNRMMFRIGTAARLLGLLECDLIIGIPLAATGKSPFFDRKET